MASDLYLGNRVFTAVSGAAVNATNSNETQDQIKEVFKARYRSIPLSLSLKDTGPADWSANMGNDPPRLEDTTGAGEVLYIGIDWREFWQIKTIVLSIGGTGVTTDGDIKIVEGIVPTGTSTPAVLADVETGIGDFGQAGGNLRITHTVVGTWAGRVENDRSYYVKLTSPTGGGAAEAFVYHIGFTHQVGT